MSSKVSYLVSEDNTPANELKEILLNKTPTDNSLLIFLTHGLYCGRQVFQNQGARAQSHPHPLPDCAGDGYAAQDGRDERDRAGLREAL